VRLKADFLRLILACPIDPARQNLLVEFVETYLRLAEREQAEFQQIVQSDRNDMKVEQMITIYEKQGIQQGIQQGKQKGKQKGKQEGKQEDLILLLEKKFGKLSAALRRKVRQIESTERLESLLLAVLDADSLEDLPL
jgi:predicted transposase/invertase (TIGR01784 family)